MTVGIADTGLVVAYLNPRDAHHAWAVGQFERYPSFETCEPVLAEAAHLVGGPGPVVGLVTSGALRLGYSLAGDEGAVAALVAKYADVPMDLADACVVRLAERHDDCEVVTVDGDFFVYRRHGSRAIPVAHPEG